jgi:hypothetical protein
MTRATRHVARGIVALGVACLGVGAGACNRGPAESALAEAGQQLAAVRAELERYAPDELAALDDAVAGARAAIAEGHYTDALRAGQALPERIRAAAGVASAAKARATAAWNEESAAAVGAVQAVTDRAAALAVAASLPRGLTPEAFASAQAEVASLTREWDEATVAFLAGDVPKAVERARDVRARAGALAATLGVIKAPAPPSAAAPR